MKALVAIVFLLLAAMNVASATTAFVRARERDAAIAKLHECQTAPPRVVLPAPMDVLHREDEAIPITEDAEVYVFSPLPPSDQCRVLVCGGKWVEVDLYAPTPADAETMAMGWRLAEPPAP